MVAVADQRVVSDGVSHLAAAERHAASGLCGDVDARPGGGRVVSHGDGQLPFSVTGIDGSMSFQENATGGSSPQRTDYRASYYHKNGAWVSSTNWYAYDHGGGIENAGLIETNSAVYYETCKSNGVYTGTITPSNPTSPTYHITQPLLPTLDSIVVTNYSAAVYGSQLLVQWQTPATSSPQFAYQ